MKRKTKISKSSPKIFRLIFIVGFLILVGFAIVYNIVQVAENSSVFVIKEIDIDPSVKFIASDHLPPLIGKNIFSIDLAKLERKLSSQYPEISKVRIVRHYPDKIQISARKRIAVAQVKANSRYATIDKNGVVLSVSYQGEKGLPVISGAKIANGIFSVEKILNVPEVKVAVAIIKAFGRDSKLKPFQITSIDVQNLSKINLLISEKLKVIMDRSNISNKIILLGLMLSQDNLNWDEIKYIDMRFKEPILGKK